jgi:hypothetical protein
MNVHCVLSGTIVRLGWNYKLVLWAQPLRSVLILQRIVSVIDWVGIMGTRWVWLDVWNVSMVPFLFLRNTSLSVNRVLWGRIPGVQHQSVLLVPRNYLIHTKRVVQELPPACYVIWDSTCLRRLRRASIVQHLAWVNTYLRRSPVPRQPIESVPGQYCIHKP